MEYLPLIIGAIVVIVLFVMQNRQLNKLTDELNRKTEANNKDTQKKIDEVFYHINDKIDRNNENVQHSIAEQLNSSRKQMTESQKVISDISARIAAINKTNEQVVNVADELKPFRRSCKTLSNVAFLVNITSTLCLAIFCHRALIKPSTNSKTAKLSTQWFS